ncbi:HEAT repeat domain-containing protein [Microcoleus sp. FACHB-831]|uniref:HEAT repeat domain-containing protein n=1 Tax=Microcoleus sp. FACHB-831 TaxID=2692827 RepID=UPI001689E359|nr:HEAT repeat domain-containing protein [Microcoleus sp. FACHB-831]MBD1923495.1 HEAT repeat domain-containing protein [Microcoleus sp. FACHB-831]
MANQQDIEKLLQRLPHLEDERLKREYLNSWEWRKAIAPMLARVESESQALRVVRLALEADLRKGATLAGSVKPEFRAKALSIVTKLKVSLPLKIRLLARTRSPLPIGLLTDLLNHQDDTVRAWSAWALVQIGTASVVSKLLPALEHQAPHVRMWATWVLGQIGGDAAIAGLISALNDKDSEIRWRAAAALGRLGSSQAIAKLLQIVGEDPEPRVRGKAATALGKIGGDSVLEGLQQALNDEQLYVCANAVYALGTVSTPGAVNVLLQALNHSNSDVRGSAVSVLGDIGTEGAIAAIMRALDDRDLLVRGRAVEALERLSAQATAGLKQALNDRDDYVRDRAAAALERLSFSVGDRHLEKTDLITKQTPTVSSQGIALPKLWITSFEQASEYIFSKTPGASIQYLISIGSPGDPPLPGYNRIPHRLRLEFDDIDIPSNDPEGVLPTLEHILKVIDFASVIAKGKGNLLIHCQAGISRSAAVALTVCARLLGSGREEQALAYVLTAKPEALPNRWIVELADEALGRGGKLIKVAQMHRESQHW